MFAWPKKYSFFIITQRYKELCIMDINKIENAWDKIRPQLEEIFQNIDICFVFNQIFDKIAFHFGIFIFTNNCYNVI